MFLGFVVVVFLSRKTSKTCSWSSSSTKFKLRCQLGMGANRIAVVRPCCVRASATTVLLRVDERSSDSYIGRVDFFFAV